MPSWDVVREWVVLLLGGLKVTLELSIVCFVLTVLLAAGLSLLAMSEYRGCRYAARSWIELFRSIPVLALMVLLYFGLGPQAAELGVGPFVIAAGSLSVSSSAYLAEIYRGAMTGVSKSQWDAAMSLGMSHGAALRTIVVPQVIPPLVPSTLNVLISVVKFSSLASLITVNELTLAGTQAVSQSFYPMQIYLLLGIFYAALIVPLIYALKAVEHWTRRRYGLVSARLEQTDPYILVDELEQSRSVA